MKKVQEKRRKKWCEKRKKEERKRSKAREKKRREGFRNEKLKIKNKSKEKRRKRRTGTRAEEEAENLERIGKEIEKKIGGGEKWRVEDGGWRGCLQISKEVEGQRQKVGGQTNEINTYAVKVTQDCPHLMPNLLFDPHK